MFYNYIDKLILKNGCNPKNEMKCFDNSDNSSDIDNYILKLFFFRFYSTYCFRMSEMVFVDIRRRRFD